MKPSHIQFQSREIPPQSIFFTFWRKLGEGRFNLLDNSLAEKQPVHLQIGLMKKLTAEVI